MMKWIMKLASVLTCLGTTFLGRIPDVSDAGITETNIWTGGEHLKYDYRFVDDLKPVAPMDELDTSSPWGRASGRAFPKAVEAFDVPETFPNMDPDVPNHMYYKVAHHDPSHPVSVADATYPNGDVIAPKDELLASMDRVKPPFDELAAAAREDRLNDKYTKYIDQVEHMERDCTNSQAPHCTIACRKDDVVSVTLLNVILTNVTLVTIRDGIATIRFKSNTAKDDSDDKVPVDCSDYPCTVSAPCYNATGNLCVKQVIHSRLSFGELEETSRCPDASKPCSTMKQNVPLRWVRKSGRTCQTA